ncbi:MAG: hypothetical protein GY810_00550 [Aureispira sp.]|nr:hypothetical protein [Aureispira sp.]
MQNWFKIYSVVYIWCCVLGQNYAQDPSYRIIGEEELSGTDIYSMIQDTAHNIWLATDKSLCKYDGYEFQYFSNSKQKRKSLFGLTKDHSNTLFCFNLSGQIFKIDQDSLHLYYELPDSLVSNNMTMYFDHNNNLLVSSNTIFLINDSLQKMVSNNKGTSFLSQNEQGTILYHSLASDSAYLWDGEQFNFYCTFPHNPSFSYYSFFSFQNEWYCFEQNSHTLYKKEASKTAMQLATQYNSPSSSIIYRQQTSDKILYTDHNGGGWLSTPKDQLFYNNQKILRSYRFGRMLIDKEKSIWIGTLGKGLLFIPNLDITTYPPLVENEGETPIKLAYNKTGNLYIGSSTGNVYQFDSLGSSELFLRLTFPSVLLKYIPESNLLLSNNTQKGRLFNLLSKTTYPATFSSIKDICFIDRQRYLIASSMGAYLYDLKTEKITKLIATRSNCTYYDHSHQLSWFGTTNGLFSFKNGRPKKMTPTVMASNIVGDIQHTWIGTTTEGILKLSGSKILDKITIQKGLYSNNIKKLLLKGHLLYIAHDKGIQVYNTETKSIKTINTTDGLLSNKIADFDVFGQELSVITNKGLQQLQLDKILPNSTIPYIELTTIMVNDSIWPKDAFELEYDQNQITFQFKAKAYRHLNSLKYLYKLDHVDKDWVSTSYLNNEAKYPFLPTGQYTFRVKAINEDGISSPVTLYSFCINPPFWQTWWFYILVSGSLVGAVSWFYQRRAKKQRAEHKQKQELLSSKLTALKSQMNPHFIFNALNSIQALILTEKLEDAYTYIVKFSNLVRRTLNYSDKDMLDIDDEIILIELYLELEKLRFRKDFEYTIVRNGVEDIKIPPMLIQPFVENAVKHGLLHKKGPKSITITLEQDDSVLACTILDNGIGRKQAQAIKDRQKKAHESFSVQSTQTRFQILQEIYKGDLGLTYEDLEENGVALGTKVILQIPFEEMY